MVIRYHFLLLLSLLIGVPSASCIKGHSESQSVSNGAEKRLSVEDYERTTDFSRWLAAATDDATADTDGKKTADTEDDTDASDDDTVSVLISDDNVTKAPLIPPEPEQPSEWPATVMVIFLVLAFALLGKTFYTNWKKRSQYQDVPTTSLIV